MNGRTLIFADVHANLAAFEAVLEAEQGWDDAIFLGDIVVGGPEPERCVSLLRAVGGLALMGNHDRQAVELAVAPDDPNPDRAWIRWTQEQLSKESVEFLRGMSNTCAVERQGRLMRLHHGDFPPELGRFWPDWPEEKFQMLAERYPEPWILATHSHVQFREERFGRVFINPGSVGQPRLGQPLACYAILEHGELEFRAVPYDVERTCRAMDSIPLPSDYVAMWKRIYRNGMLSDRYPLRKWEPLIRAGYR